MASHIWAAISDWELGAEFDSTKTDYIQAAFESLSQSELIYHGALSAGNLLHCTRAVARNPESLEAHVRRIYMATALAERDELAGAMIDLLWVLGEKGSGLKQHLFEQVSAMLRPRVRSVIGKAIESGDSAPLLALPIDRAVVVNGGFSITV